MHPYLDCTITYACTLKHPIDVKNNFGIISGSHSRPEINLDVVRIAAFTESYINPLMGLKQTFRGSSPISGIIS